MNPSYIWGLRGCFKDMHSTSHSQSRFLKSVNGRTGSTQTRKGAWSSTQAVPRAIKVLLLRCIDETPDVGTAFTLGLHTTVFPTKRYANKACIMENTEESYTGRNIYILPDTQGAMKALDSFQIIPNYSQTAINPW
jgi:hypothetical protein